MRSRDRDCLLRLSVCYSSDKLNNTRGRADEGRRSCIVGQMSRWVTNCRSSWSRKL